MQVDAAPAQPADVPPPATIAVEDASEEEAEVSKYLHVKVNKILFFEFPSDLFIPVYWEILAPKCNSVQ